jgi:hypothetical protein
VCIDDWQTWCWDHGKHVHQRVFIITNASSSTNLRINYTINYAFSPLDSILLCSDCIGTPCRRVCHKYSPCDLRVHSSYTPVLLEISETKGHCTHPISKVQVGRDCILSWTDFFYHLNFPPKINDCRLPFIITMYLRTVLISLIAELTIAFSLLI